MGSADMKGLRFPDAQESRFHAWKRSYMGIAVLQGCRFADILTALCIMNYRLYNEWH